MESLGVTLKKLREEKGLTVKDISGITKIREPLILALEAEQWEKLPEKIFIRGFVRSFIQAVGGDASLILDMFESACPGEEGKIVYPDYQKRSFKGLERKHRKYLWVIVVVIFLIGIGGGLAYYFFSPSEGVKLTEKTSEVKNVPAATTETSDMGKDTGKTQNSEVTTGEAPGETAPSEQAREGQGSQENLSPQSGSSVIQNEANGVKAPAGEKASAPSEATEQPAVIDGEKKKENPAKNVPEKATPVEKRGNLVIKAKMETWISLKIDGKAHKEILLKPGDRFEVQVKKTADLLIGNAGGIDIEFNGKALAPVGESGQVVRLKLPFEKN